MRNREARWLACWQRICMKQRTEHRFTSPNPNQNDSLSCDPRTPPFTFPIQVKSRQVSPAERSPNGLIIHKYVPALSAVATSCAVSLGCSIAASYFPKPQTSLASCSLIFPWAPQYMLLSFVSCNLRSFLCSSNSAVSWIGFSWDRRWDLCGCSVQIPG